MKKIIIYSLIVISMLSSGCSSANLMGTDSQESEHSAQTEIIVVGPKSPAIIPLLRMIDNNDMGDDVKITLRLYGNMDAMMAMASEDDYDLLIVPVHTAANLKNKGMDVGLLNVFNWGGMALSTTDSNCHGWKDLAGKELYVPAKGSVPDILTQFFLQQNDLTIGSDVEVVYSSHVEIAQLLSVGTIEYAIDAQPFVTANEKRISGYKAISEFNEEWQKTQGETSAIPANCMVVRKKYLCDNEELIKDFSEKFTESVEWVVANPRKSGMLAEENIKADAQLIAEAMHRFCFDCRSASESQQDIENYYRVLLEMKPECIGGEMPDQAFYDLKAQN